MAKFALVTVLYNSINVLPDFMRCLGLQTKKDFCLYAIDNASNDGSSGKIEDLARKFTISLRLTINGKNRGVAAANNQGIAQAIIDGCEIIVLINNDIEFDSETLSTVAFRFDKGDVQVLAPKILFFSNRTIWFGGGGFSTLKGINEHWGVGNADGLRFNIERRMDYAPTCFVAFASSVFERVGMMDERYFVYYDDTDFMFRMRKAGYSVLFFPRITILHKVSSSTGGDLSEFSLRYLNRNRILFLRKSYPPLLQLVYFCVFFISKLPFMFRLTHEKRRRLIDGIIEGFSLPVR